MLNPDEVSHVAQWLEICTKAKNNNFYIALHAGGFGLWKQPHPSRIKARDFLGTYYSFHDLRQAVNDAIALRKRLGGGSL